MTDTRDVAIGAVVTGARLGIAAGQLALLPARAAARAPVIGGPIRRALDGLEVEGRLATEQGRRLVDSMVGEVVSAPEISSAVGTALDAGLMDTIVRSLVEHRVVEQIVVDVAASTDVDAVLEHEATRRLIDAALASAGLERVLVTMLDSHLLLELTDRILRSPEMQLTIERIAASPELRRALTDQTGGLAEDMVDGVRRRSETLDDAVERSVRGWLRRPRPGAT